MFTTDGACFKCSEEVAALVAGWAGLAQVLGQGKCDKYSLWQDPQTAGGAARICWKDGYAFVSRHSGYAQADVTEEVEFFLEDQGAVRVSMVPARNPHIYGVRDWDTR